MHPSSPAPTYRNFGFIEGFPISTDHARDPKRNHGGASLLRAVLAYPVSCKHDVVHMTRNKGLELLKSLARLWICGGSALKRSFLLLLSFLNASQVFVFMDDEHHVV